MAETWELMRAAVPSRAGKKRLARLLGYSGESMIYKWCEDPDGSGRPNPIDSVDAILDYARLRHPDAALAITQHFEAENLRALGRRAGGLSLTELLTSVQPGTEKEAVEAIRAFSAALRQMVVSGTCDLEEVLREIEEAERQLKTSRVMIRAVLENQVPAGEREEG